MLPRPSSPLSLPCRCLVAASGLVILLPAAAPLRAGEIGFPKVQVNGPAYLVPAGAARWVYPGSPEAPPAVTAFWEGNGPDWRIFWDTALDSARFVYPLDRLPLVPPEAQGPDADPSALVHAAAAAIELASGLLGVGPRDLTGASSYAVGTSRVVVFGQASPGGLLVSGTEVRVVIHENGDLGWIQAYTLRHCPAGGAAVLGEADITRRVESSGGTVRRASLELGFPGEDPAVAIPIYRLHSADADGGSSEWIVDASSGEVLVRRRDLRFAGGAPPGGAAEFPVEGIVRARLLDEDSGRLVTRPVGAALLQDGRERLLGTSDEDGFFAFLVGENPAEIRASLRTGKCQSPAAPPCFPVPRDLASRLFVPTLVVRPQLSGGGGPNQLPPGDDIDGDGIPDVSAFHEVDRLFDVVFNGGTPPDRVDELLDRSWWFTCFEAGVGALAYVDRLAARFALEHPSFHPLRCVELKPAPSAMLESAYQPPLRDSCGILLTSRRIVDARDPNAVERTPVSILLHEIGHHVFASLTGLGAAGTTGIEEGFADAFAGMVTGSCRVGYLADATPTSRAFCLGATGDAYRDAPRRTAGNAFWALHRRLPREGALEEGVDPLPGEETQGAALILAWLVFQHVPDGRPRGFGNDNDLLEQLLVCDDTHRFGGDNLLSNGTPHEAVILDIFRGTRFFEAPFVRGDTTPDFRFDITDGINVFNFLFLRLGPHRDCLNAFDADDSGRIEVTDGIFLLNYLFMGGKPLPAPFPACGLDPQAPGHPGNLGCYDYVCPR